MDGYVRFTWQTQPVNNDPIRPPFFNRAIIFNITSGKKQRQQIKVFKQEYSELLSLFSEVLCSHRTI